ncbi:MAG: HDIG domain-containing protein [Bacilli bacterium]|nr:HDIG domain-containing protein [Bacilli bacterium]
MSKSIDKILKKDKYMDCIRDLIDHEKVQEMNNYIQHGNTTTLDHCIRVSYTSYKISKLFKMDYKSTARAALLHDLYLYDWHKNDEKTSFFKKHGFTHASKALENANKYFKLNRKEKDIIKKHMWPLTLRSVPRYKESFVVSMVDKYKSTGETLVPYTSKIAKACIFFINIFVNLVK